MPNPISSHIPSAFVPVSSRINRTPVEAKESVAPTAPSAAAFVGTRPAGSLAATDLPLTARSPGAGSSPLRARLEALTRVEDGRASKPTKVGVLLTSHGDIDDRRTQLREYVREAVLRNPGLPLPAWIRPAIDAIGWPLQAGELNRQYDAIGPTHYDENSRKQADALTSALKDLGIEGKAYVGYNFTHPMIDEAVAKMKADGVTHVVVFNQGAQNSIATMGESVHEVQEALEKHPDWSVKAIAVNEFNDDQRFVQLLGDRLIEDAQKAFPGAKPEETLILLTSHGLPKHLIDKGDPAVADMLASVEKLKARLKPLGYQVEHGFLNDDFFPGAEWTKPDSEGMANKVVEEVLAKKRIAPKHVLLDGRLSFTVHHRATLFDANVETRKVLEEPQGPAWARFPGADVKLAPNFDDDAGLAALYASLTKEALEGKAANTVTIAEPK